jgi:hypothetical protein
MMPVLRSKTVRDENAMIAFLQEENVPGLVGGPDYTVNSSGWISIFCNDAHQDRGTTPIYGAPAGAAADQASYAAALAAGHYSTAINVANASKIIIGIEVVTAATSKALHLNLRLSNLGDPSLTTADHWFRQLVAPNYSSSKYDVDVAEYVFKHQLLTSGAKYTLELPVAANWANIVLHNTDAAARFKIYADIG